MDGQSNLVDHWSGSYCIYKFKSIKKINKRMDNPTPETIYHVNIKKCDLA